MASPDSITVGVLALQGAFSEHVQLLTKAFAALDAEDGVKTQWRCIEVRTPQELGAVDALIVPGGERYIYFLV